MQLDNKCQEMSRLEAEIKKLKGDVSQADQANNDLRGRMMDKELEIESLQVTISMILITFFQMFVRWSCVSSELTRFGSCRHNWKDKQMNM